MIPRGLEPILSDKKDKKLERQYLVQLGDRLQKQRKNKHLTQAKLSKRLDVSRTTIANIENGFQRTSLFLLARIAEELEEPISAFIPPLADVREKLQQNLKRSHNPITGKLVTDAITSYGVTPITQPRDSVEQVLKSHDVPPAPQIKSRSRYKPKHATTRRQKTNDPL